MKITHVKLYLVSAGEPGPEPDATGRPHSWESWWQARTLVANPMSVYPEYATQRSLWLGPAHEPYAVEIETDAGVTGCAVNFGGGPFACAVIRQHLERFLIGQSPFNIERIWDQMERSTRPYGLGGIVGAAMAGVDLALWDLLGRALQQPVYNLIGGRVRDEIPCYVTVHPDFAEDWIARGFFGVKIAAPYGVESGRDGILRMEEIIAGLREKIGNRAELMVDCYMSWSIDFAARLAERIRGCDVQWFEDTLPNGWAHENNRELRARIKPIAVAVGNLEFHYQAFHELLVNRACDILQPEMQTCGGLTAVRRIAALAKPYGVPVIPHTASAYSYHFTISNANSPYAEYMSVGNGRDLLPTFGGMVEGEPLPVNGKVTLDDRPGFGVELNRKALVPYED